MNSSGPIVGIDLGTTHSVVARLDRDGKPETIKNTEGEPTTPSAVFFDSQGIIVGREAVKAARFEPQRIAMFAKRDVGRAAYRREICGEVLPPEVVQSLILSKLKEDAEMRIGPIHKVVITVPAFFNEPRRKATQDAGRLAGLDVIDIINEPTAAAIAYGVEQGFIRADGTTRQKEIVLVYDLGGGTFDATLMELHGHHFNAIATAGDVYLGGIDWDGRLVDILAEKFLAKHGVDLRDDAATFERLRQEAEDAKHTLTARGKAIVGIENSGKHARITVTREEFDDRTGDLLDRTEFTIGKLLRDAGMTWKDITRVLVVGGSSRMPMVLEMLEQQSQLPVDRSLSPDEAVAHGAALYAGFLLSGEGPHRPQLSVCNVSSHDLSVLAEESKTGLARRKILIPRNTRLPAEGVGRFVTRSEDQRTVAIMIVEGGDERGKNATPIGKCVICDLPPKLPARTPVEVIFHYQESGRLTVKASLPGTRHEATLMLERDGGLTEDRIRHWQQELAVGLTVGLDEESLASRPASQTETDASTHTAHATPDTNNHDTYNDDTNNGDTNNGDTNNGDTLDEVNDKVNEEVDDEFIEEADLADDIGEAEQDPGEAVDSHPDHQIEDAELDVGWADEEPLIEPPASEDSANEQKAPESTGDSQLDNFLRGLG